MVWIDLAEFCGHVFTSRHVDWAQFVRKFFFLEQRYHPTRMLRKGGMVESIHGGSFAL